MATSSLERLQKILARGGIASRRAAEKLITDGRVRVNGKVVTELGSKADPFKDKIEVEGKRVVLETPVYILLHKPRGVVATMSDPEGRPTVSELLKGAPGRVYPVGRLDFATSGALFATNDGDFAEGMMHPKRDVPKTYVLKVSGVMQPEDVEIWRKGIKLEDGMTLPARAALIRHDGDKTWLELTIREGRNQQIRRMGDATGFPVMRLSRISFAEITTEGLRPGQWRHLTREELIDLKKTYGVPKAIRASADHEVKVGGERARSDRRNDRAKEPRVVKGKPTTNRDRDRGPRTEPAQGARGRPSRSTRGAAPRREDGANSSKPSTKTGASDNRTQGARYGGGSPGRRSTNVKEDWGGGVARGGRHAHRDDRPREDLGGGRGAQRTRTTGTGGGVRAGAGDDASYRISRTRRGR
jgi:23S rRNA pseudouridine2605 synthase